MAFKSRTIMGIVIVCSLGMLSNCAFPVRPGYDRKSGSYKRYRVPKQAPIEADSSTINPQDELVLEEKLATATTTDTTVTQDSVAESSGSQNSAIALNDSTGNKEQNSGELIQKKDSVAVKTADSTAKAAPKKT